MKLFELIKSLFVKKKKSFQCGGKHIIEIQDDDFKSLIYYRDPTGEELINFTYTTLDISQSAIKQLAYETNPTALQEKTHIFMLRDKMIPYAKKIIVDWDGYKNKDNKDIKNIDLLAKYYPLHLQKVVEYAFQSNEKYKKKN
jgi:hypothetical protein